MTREITTTPPAPARWRSSHRDLGVGTPMLVALGAIFVHLSSGWSLLVTFVPGALFTWLAFAHLYRSRQEQPEVGEFLPVFVATLAIQFAHFAEEFATGFHRDFPLLYGGQPYGTKLFVVFNMAAYAAFALGAVTAVTRPIGVALVPALVFLVYGALGGPGQRNELRGAATRRGTRSRSRPDRAHTAVRDPLRIRRRAR